MGAVRILSSQEKPGEIDGGGRHPILVARDVRVIRSQLLVDGERLAVELLRLRCSLRVLQQDSMVVETDREALPIGRLPQKLGDELFPRLESLKGDLL